MSKGIQTDRQSRIHQTTITEKHEEYGLIPSSFMVSFKTIFRIDDVAQWAYA